MRLQHDRCRLPCRDGRREPVDAARHRIIGAFNHYSLFKTSEQLLHLPFIGNARDPRVKSMAPAFHF